MDLLNLNIRVGAEDNATSAINGISTNAIAKASAIGQAMYDAAKTVASASYNMVKDFTQGVISNYGQFEQMQGGIEKLYGDAASTVIDNSKRAFREAGMSQTQYLQSSTTLAASLIKSLDGDMQAAADRNATAMKAIADNADTFGTSVEDVTAVYSSLSRGMYQTLDNLRLGYAGTKEGMQSLIADANAYAEEIGETSGMTIDSFADIVRAIDLIQQKQGIAGTTMKEALTTIEGSVRMATNSFEDFKTAIGSGDVERIKETMGNISMAIFGAFNEESGQIEGGIIRNILPRFENAIKAVASYLPQLAGQLATGVADMIAQAMGIDTGGMESAFDMGVAIAGKIAEGISSFTGIDVSKIFGKLTETVDLSAITSAFGEIGTALQGFWASLTETVDVGYVTVAIEKIGEIAQQVWGFVQENILPNMPTLGEVIGTVANTLMDIGTTVLTVLDNLGPFVPAILAAVGAFTAVSSIMTTVGGAVAFLTTVIIPAISAVGSFGGAIAAMVTLLGGPIPIIAALIAAIVAFFATNEEAREKVVEIWNSIVETVSEFISDFTQGMAELAEATSAQWEEMKAAIADKWNQIVSSVINAVTSVVTTVIQKWGQIRDTTRNVWNTIVSTIVGIVTSIINRVTNGWSNIVSAVTSAMSRVSNGVSAGWNAVVSFVSSIPSRIISALGNLGSLLYSAGSDIIQGLKNGILSNIGSVASTITGGMKSAVSAVKSFLGIASPSKLFKQLGEFTMEGYAIGLESMTDDVVKVMKNAADAVYGAADASATYGYDAQMAVPAFDSNARGGDVYYVTLSIEDRNDFDGMALAFVNAVQARNRMVGKSSTMNVRMA